MKEVICKCGATMPDDLLQIHVRSAHTEYWKQVEGYLEDTDVKLSQLEEASNTRSRGYAVYAPIIVHRFPYRTPRLAVYDLTEDSVIEG